MSKGGDPAGQDPVAAAVNRLPARRAWWALAPLLTGTFLGTVNNNIVNVPLRDILAGLSVPLSRGVLVIVGFTLTFAVLMPLTGWLGDRLGRRRVFCAAMVGLAVGALGASTAPTLPALVAFRVLQGASTAAVLPTVMGLIADLFDETARGRAMGLWASVNGLGQATGPPVGGFIAEWLTWRWMFVPIAPLAALAFIATLRLVPATPGRGVTLDWRSALALTVGATLVITAVTAVPQDLPTYAAPTLAAAGVVILFGFVAAVRSARQPFVSPQLIHDRAYLRSSLAVFAQMFCLGAAILAVPLYLTSAGRASTATAGLVVFALPATMGVLAPAVGLLTDSRGPRAVIRSGLVVIAVSQLLLAAVLTASPGQAATLVMTLVLVGSGIALVQTPAATGATRSPHGRIGAGLGLFNLVRFSGSALGAATVVIVLRVSGSYGLLFVLCAGVAVLGLIGTFAGPPDSFTRERRLRSRA